MATETAEITLEIKPETRFAVIDMTQRLADQCGDLFVPFRKLLYCSYHTTAGFLEQSLTARLGHDRDSVEALVASTKKLFPEGAAYHHDRMELRDELTAEQKLVEPLNADSHLTFIGLGLENCVTYDNRPDTPVYFIDLDGVFREHRRNRRATVVGFNQESVVHEFETTIPVSTHPIDSVNLKDPRLGLHEQINEQLARYGVGKGRVVLALEPGEQQAALTVNEYETLLMRHDLAEVLRNPFRFMAEKGINMLRDPLAIRSKAKNYVKYDLVHVVNEFIDTLGLSESWVERLIDKFAAAEASRRLRMKRSVNLLVNNTDERGIGSIVHGTYQSPILVQWNKPTAGQQRRVSIKLIRFE